MNVEMKMKVDANQLANSKQAQELKIQGDSELKTSCLLCKFKPNYLDAIPFYKNAANLFKSALSYDEEIYCREKLTLCFRNINSFEEEGKEFENISFIYFAKNKYSESIKVMNNAFQSYFSHPSYDDAVDCMKSLASKFLEINDLDNAEKCLEICYQTFLKIFHTFKKDDPTKIFYDAIEQYVSVLFQNDKIRISINCLNQLIKVSSESEENKFKTLIFYCFLISAHLVNEDEENLIKISEEAKKFCQTNSDYSLVDSLLQTWEAIKKSDSNNFSYCITTLQYHLPHEIVKKLKSLFDIYSQRIQEEKNKSPSVAKLINNPDQPRKNSGTINGEDMIVIIDEKLNSEENNDYL